jgi:ERCC4-type nuclease
MKIVFDERETTLYNNCISYIATQNQQLKTSLIIEKRVLPIGDVLFYTNDNVLLSIIERKTIPDLFASIKDGRYEEQSYRLSHNGECSLHSVIYIIEGNISTLRGPAEKKLLYSTITSLNFFKGFSVLRSQSCMDTAELLVHMADKIDRKLQAGVSMPSTINSTATITSRETEQNYCTVVKKVKKDNITPENIGEIILCQIPGISSTTATAIMKKFNSFSHLMDELKTNPSCLDNIVIDSKGKIRKVSKSCIESVRTYLLPRTLE